MTWKRKQRKISGCRGRWSSKSLHNLCVGIDPFHSLIGKLFVEIMVNGAFRGGIAGISLGIAVQCQSGNYHIVHHKFNHNPCNEDADFLWDFFKKESCQVGNDKGEDDPA